jgi:hypothetical protein
MGEARKFMRIGEVNPLLACLRRFWSLERNIYDLVERASETPSAAGHAFQAGISHLLPLSGFQSVNLGRDDKLREAGSKVVIGTADILAYSKTHQALVVGACTISVPSDQDYEMLLHASEILKREVPESSGVTVVPVMFCGQRSEPLFGKTLDRRGIRLLNQKELARWHQLIEPTFSF